MKGLFDIADRVVVVTGGLGQLGRQFTLSLTQQGAKVAVLDLHPEGSPRTEVLRAACPRDRLLILGTDITQRESLESALREVQSHWGTPWGLVNNAALDSNPAAPVEENGPFENYLETSWDQVMEVNTKGIFLACQVIGGAMAQEGRGSIITISSIYGMVSPDQRIYEYRRTPEQAFFKPVAYSVSKSALFNLTRYLATYWAPRNVRVNTLTFAGVFNHQDERFLKAYCAKVPLGRMAREDEYNGAVTFLLSDASSYMTGSNMVLDGGFLAW